MRDSGLSRRLTSSTLVKARRILVAAIFLAFAHGPSLLFAGDTTISRSAPPAAPPAAPSKWEQYLRQDSLSWDWFGYRETAKNTGVSLTGYFTADLLGNPTGGKSRGFDAASSSGLQLTLDFERMGGPSGMQFVTSMIWRAGDNLSGDHIGNLNTVAQLYGGQNLRLYEFLLRESLWDHQLLFQVGRMGAFDNFLSLPIYGNFVNNGICGNAKGVFFSVPAFGQTVYPTASWGALVKWDPADSPWYVQAGAYLLDSDNGANRTSGLNWTFDVDLGAAALLQVGYNLNARPSDTGMPGQYAVGAFFSGDNQPTFSTTPTSRSNAGGWIMLEQMVYRPDSTEWNMSRRRNTYGPKAMNGLTAFFTAVITPMDEISMFPVYVNGGLTYQGIIPCRPDDFLAFGVVWGGVSDQLQNLQAATSVPVQTEETVLELNYRYYVTPFFYIQPDIQYVINPGATGQIDDALVLGAQVSVNF